MDKRRGRGAAVVCLLLAGVSQLCAQSGGPERRVRLSLPDEGGPRRQGALRTALLIGNKDYRVAPLRNPLHDVEDLDAVLRRLGFQTRVLKNATADTVRSGLDEYVKATRRGAISLFYYSGHGLQIDGESYLVPVDFAARTEEEAKRAAVPLRAIQRQLETGPAAMNLIVLDSCRNSPFSPEAAQRRGLAAFEAGLGSYVAFAASPGRVASDNGDERNGLFTKYLLAALTEKVNVSTLFRKVRQQVDTASGGHQIPYLHDQIIADFSLAGAAPEQVNAPPEEPGIGMDLRENAKQLYYLGQCAQSAALFEEHVKANPESPLAQNALGLAYVCMQMKTAAIARFSMAIHLKPDYVAAYWNRGQLYLDSAQYELALQDFNWAVEQDPSNSVSYWKRGRARFGLRRYEEAKTDFDEAIRLNPVDADAYLGRGQVEYRLGDFRAAAASFDQAIRWKSGFRAAYADRARARERLGDAAGAAADRAKAAAVATGP